MCQILLKAKENGILSEEEKFSRILFLGIYYLVKGMHKWITNYAELCPKHRCD